MVNETTVLNGIAAVAIICILYAAWSLIQWLVGSMLSTNANIGIMGLLGLTGVLAYVSVRRKTKEF
jgi:hypothetical protein